RHLRAGNQRRKALGACVLIRAPPRQHAGDAASCQPPADLDPTWLRPKLFTACSRMQQHYVIGFSDPTRPCGLRQAVVDDVVHLVAEGLRRQASKLPEAVLVDSEIETVIVKVR